jgi:hypothetical protein
MYLRKLSLSIVAMIIAMPMASAHMHHANMNHAAMMGNNTAATPAVLTESGTDPFATIQEVITALEANPDTNWEKSQHRSITIALS